MAEIEHGVCECPPGLTIGWLPAIMSYEVRLVRDGYSQIETVPVEQVDPDRGIEVQAVRKRLEQEIALRVWIDHA